MEDEKKYVYVKPKNKITPFAVFNTILFIIISLLILFPLVKVLVDSFDSAAGYGLRLWPEKFTFSAYKSIVTSVTLYRPFLVSLLVTVAGTFLGLLLSTLGAYVLIQWEMPGRTLFSWLLLFTMLFSGGMIPAYLNIRNLGLYNSLWALILPGALSVYNSIICKTAIESVPESLKESAYIDGANDVIILFRIIVPLIKATLAVLLLYYGVGHWNAWFNASIYLKDNEKLPIQNIMRAILIANSNVLNSAAAENDQVNQFAEAIKYSTIILTTVPVLCIYPFIQKYFVKGVMIGAVKG